MVDIPGDSTTGRSISVGGTLTDELEVVNDHDWIRINLTAGQSISVALDGGTLVDPYLRIYDASGNLLFENDDVSSGSNRNSLLAFTATYTGVYYIDVAAWVPPPSSPDYPGYTGTYTLSVSPYTPPPVGTIQQIANQLTTGYWNGDTHHFAVSPGGTITVNITQLTPEGQALARAALGQWTDIIGVTFAEVVNGGQIVFDDNQDGAFSNGTWSGGIISSANVNVSTQWISNYGSGLNTYSYQTYIHEIGHALGLGHGGNYNSEARYPFDARYSNDSWAMTIMSYFDQQENTYFAGQGFQVNFLTTPMMADILAMSQLYGLSTTTRAGDTTYGQSWTASMGALCIFDSGGNDTIDVSAWSGSQRVDLNGGTFSNVVGENGNVSIALNVVIENARTGSGNDTIVGNSVANVITGGLGNDNLTGGAGNDSFSDTTSGLNGDTITDFVAGDRIVFTNATLGSFTFSLSGNTLSYSGGSLTLTGFSGTLTASAAAGGGVQLTVGSTPIRDVANDFNRDGRSDILWRSDTGVLTNWLATESGGFTANWSNSNYGVPVDWQVHGTGDFNGDGLDDILWRNSAGTTTNWLADASGGFAPNWSNFGQDITNAWQIAGVGDFNGDGRDDILWRDSAGTITNWLANPNGGFAANWGNSNYGVPTDWHVAGIGDFNGDGRDDILWRNSAGTFTDWLADSNGGFAANWANSAASMASSWHVAGIGDFNGDNYDDILWRNDGGQLTDWLGNANGGFTNNIAVLHAGIPTNWHVAAIGDFNGDGRDDILWRNADNGQLTDWLGNLNGGFTDNWANAANGAPTSWHTVPAETLV